MRRFICCFLWAVTGLMPVTYAQSYSTNSNFRIEMGPGQINPLQFNSSPSWHIEDYIAELTVPGDISVMNTEGNTFFNYTGFSGNLANSVYYGKFFFDGVSDIGIDSGIVLSTGRVLYCGVGNTDPGTWPGIPHAAQYHSSGPQQHAVNCNGEPSVDIFRYTQYADLVAINNGDSILDANVLDFDFVAKGNMIKLDYVFASEEFTRVDCNGPTDVMGIFLSGPGIIGEQNIAVLPGTNTPINPHTVWPANSPCFPENPASSPYYVDNTNGQNVIFDGFTTVLTAVAQVNPCDTYHLRVAVADGALHPYDTTFVIMAANTAPPQDPFDSINNAQLDSRQGRILYDSGLFLKFGSFRSTDSLWLEALGGTSLSSAYPYAVRGCLNGKIRVNTATAWPLDRELELVLSGDAIAGTDFQPFSTTVIIPAGETSTEIDVIALTGGSGTKTLQAALKSPYGPCSGLGDYLDTAALIISDGYYVDAQPADTTICEGCSVQLRVQGEDFLNYSWTPATGLDDPNSKEPIASPTSNTLYTVTATPPAGYPCSGGMDSVFINLDPTGIEGMEATGPFQVYPNPFTSGFRIQIAEGNPETVYTLKIYNVLGQVVYQVKDKLPGLNAGLRALGSTIPRGTYWLLLQDKDSKVYRKQVVRW